MKNSRTRITSPTIVAVVVGVLILGGAAYFGARDYHPVIPNYPVLQNTGTPFPVEPPYDITVPITETSTWKTFSDDWYGFSFKYPSRFGDMKLVQAAERKSGMYLEDHMTKYHDRVEALLSSRAGDLTFNVFPINQYVFNDIPGGQYWSFDSTSGRWYQYDGSKSVGVQPQTYAHQDKSWVTFGTGDGGWLYRVYVLPIPAKKIVIEVGISAVEEKIALSDIEKILSTFTFFDNGSDLTTSAYRTYRNERIGIEFDYPKTWGELRTRFTSTKEGDYPLDGTGERFEILGSDIEFVYGVTPDYDESGEFGIPFGYPGDSFSLSCKDKDNSLGPCVEFVVDGRKAISKYIIISSPNAGIFAEKIYTVYNPGGIFPYIELSVGNSKLHYDFLTIDHHIEYNKINNEIVRKLNTPAFIKELEPTYRDIEKAFRSIRFIKK